MSDSARQLKTVPRRQRALVVRLVTLQRRCVNAIKNSRLLRLLAHRHLVSLRAAALARGLAIGMFCAMLPIPFQMFPAALLCWLGFGNLPVAVICVWISNPFTYLPIFYAEYKIGMLLFHSEASEVFSFDEFAANYEDIISSLGDVYAVIWQGALVLGGALAAGSYFFGAPLSRYLSRFSKLRMR